MSGIRVGAKSSGFAVDNVDKRICTLNFSVVHKKIKKEGSVLESVNIKTRKKKLDTTVYKRLEYLKE